MADNTDDNSRKPTTETSTFRECNWQRLRDYLSALNNAIWLVISSSCHFSLQSAGKDQQDMRAVPEKPHGAIVTFDAYRNLQLGL